MNKKSIKDNFYFQEKIDYHINDYKIWALAIKDYVENNKNFIKEYLREEK